jgi:hypothetical protein
MMRPLAQRLNCSSEIHMHLVAKCLPLALVLCLAAACQDQGGGGVVGDAAQADTSFIVTGTLVDQDEAPVSRAEVMVFQVFEDPTSYIVDFRDGFIRNPKAETDAAGRFEIEVQRSFATPGGGIKFTAKPYSPGGLSYQPGALTNEMGIPIVVVVDAGTRVVDLDEISGKIVIRIED